MNGNPGSPLRILNTISKYEDRIKNKDFELIVLFNELDGQKYNELERNIKECGACKLCNIKLYNMEFKEIFNRISSTQLKEIPALLFMDQNGIKEITEQVLLTLNGLKKTDFMFFISSFYFNRFANENSFRQTIPISKDDINKRDYFSIHRTIHDAFTKMLPENSELKLYPFSIKRNASINGLIFGTKHVLGAEKILRILWKENPINGEANFDIDNDIEKQEQRPLFEELRKYTKKDDFKKNFEEYFSKKGTFTNKEIYEFTLENGFVPSLHATPIIKAMINDGRLEKLFEGRGFYIGYKQCFKDEKIVKYHWTGG